MIALLLLNLGEKNPKKVTIQITFEAQKGQNTSLGELLKSYTLLIDFDYYS
jgi:hypothetical protein